MAYFISKPSLIDSTITVYYTGAGRWSDDPNQKALFATKKSANDLIVNHDGKNGGWKNSKVVSE